MVVFLGLGASLLCKPAIVHQQVCPFREPLHRLSRSRIYRVDDLEPRPMRFDNIAWANLSSLYLYRLPVLQFAPEWTLWYSQSFCFFWVEASWTFFLFDGVGDTWDVVFREGRPDEVLASVNFVSRAQFLRSDLEVGRIPQWFVDQVQEFHQTFGSVQVQWLVSREGGHCLQESWQSENMIPLTSASLQDKDLTSQAAMHIDFVPVYNLEPGRGCNVRSLRADRRRNHCPLPFR